ncbi:MAG: peptidylprolyl isomerase [bacterium]
MHFVFLCLVLANSLNARVLDRIVATVNGQAIFYSDFSARLKPFIEQINVTVKDEDGREKHLKRLKKEILDAMIEEKVLAGSAKEMNVQVTESEVEQGVAEVRARFKTEKEYSEELEKQGMKQAGMREHIKEQLMTIKLINSEVRAKISEPKEEEIRKFYDENEEKMVVGEQVRVKQIFFEVKDKQKEDVRKIAEKALAEVKKRPEDFGNLAEKYSSIPENAGDTGYFGREDKIPEFEKPCFKLKVGAVSDIVETPLGYHIIKCIGRKAPEKKTFAESKEYIKNYLFTAKMEEKYTRWVRALRDQATIKILDKELLE